VCLCVCVCSGLPTPAHTGDKWPCLRCCLQACAHACAYACASLLQILSRLLKLVPNFSRDIVVFNTGWVNRLTRGRNKSRAAALLFDTGLAGLGGHQTLMCPMQPCRARPHGPAPTSTLLAHVVALPALLCPGPAPCSALPAPASNLSSLCLWLPCPAGCTTQNTTTLSPPAPDTSGSSLHWQTGGRRTGRRCLPSSGRTLGRRYALGGQGLLGMCG